LEGNWKAGGIMQVARLAVRRPTLMLMIGLAIAVFSAVAVPRLGLDLLPKLNLPVLGVVTIYPNADPEAVEQAVAKPVESLVRTIAGLDQVHTIAVENASITIAQFRWGTNLDAAAQELTDRLKQVRMTLPDGAQDPTVLRLDPTQMPVMMLGISGNMSPAELTGRVEADIQPLLEQTPGVARVNIMGGTRREIQVLYDPDKLEQYGLSPSLLTQIIQFQNMSVPVGNIRKDGKEYPARVGSRLASVDELKGLVVGMRPQTAADNPLGAFGFLVPQFLTLGDVAEVQDGFESSGGFTRVNGQPAVLVAINKESEVNTVVVARSLSRTLARLTEEHKDLQVTTIFDQSQFIQLSIRDVSVNALIGGLLAMLVIFLFLRDVWSTLVIGLAIPLSVLVTGIFMYFGGLTINLMSLGGLALGIGMLVDNSIVVLESIFRHYQLGEERVEAAVRGTGEVLAAITGSTLTTLAVFLPVVFVGGIAGELFRELALTVSMALTASLLVSATFVPLLASRGLGRGQAAGQGENQGEGQAGGQGGGQGRVQLAGVGGRVAWFDRLQRAYGRVLDWSLVHRPHLVGGLAALAAFTAVLVPFMGTEFIPRIDMGQFSVDVELPVGSPPEETDRLAREVEKLVAAIPEVESFSTQVGTGGGSDFISQLTGMPGNQGTLTVTLRPKAERRRSTAAVVGELREKVAGLAQRFPEASISISDEAQVAGAFGSFLGRQVTVEIRGFDAQAMAEVGREVVERLRKTGGLTDIRASQDEVRPMLVLAPERTRLLLGGLTSAQLGMGVRDALVGAQAGYVVVDGGVVPVVVRAALSAPSLETVEDLRVAGSNLGGMMAGGGSAGAVGAEAASMGAASAGASGATATRGMAGLTPSYVRVRSVVEAEEHPSPLTIERLDGQRILTVNATPVDGNIGAASNRVEKALAGISLPPGVSVRLGGVTELMRDSFADLWLALILSIILVYMVMAAQFESLRHPLVIMLTVPLAAIGAILATAAAGATISIISLVGLIILTGIAVNNGIVLVDYANQLRRQGMSPLAAVRQAGRVRLRPVLMTAITTIVGLFPLAFSSGEGAEIDKPLALAVMGGLLATTFLTLFFIPMLWEWVESWQAARQKPVTATADGLRSAEQ